jgi:hypothetical protein
MFYGAKDTFGFFRKQCRIARDFHNIEFGVEQAGKKEDG